MEEKKYVVKCESDILRIYTVKEGKEPIEACRYTYFVNEATYGIKLEYGKPVSKDIHTELIRIVKNHWAIKFKKSIWLTSSSQT
jgi:hypothetical protein